MYQALYRKWRPKTFSEVVGQDHITATLQRQVAENHTAHAYLFTGAAGAGEKISVGGVPLSHLALEGGGDVALSHNFAERSGPPLAVKRLIHPVVLLCKK